MNTTPDRGVDAYALSPMQEGMFVHHLQGAADGVDIEQVIGALHEPINAAAFEQAWREMVDRHAILRTSFAWDGGAPHQIVHPRGTVRLSFQHVEFANVHEARRGLDEYLDADRREGFDLENAPLIRVALFCGGVNEFWFVLTYHHLVLDTRATYVLFQEVFALHDAMAKGAEVKLPEPRPYRGYIQWLGSRDLGLDERFWRDLLQGFSGPTPLPYAGREADAAGTDLSRAELCWRLSADETSRLRSFAQTSQVTLNTLFQAAWAVLLARCSGEKDVVFGAVRACRHLPVAGAEAMVGMLINTVPVRAAIDDDLPVGDLLRQLRAQWLAVREHEHAPLLKVQQWSDVPPGQPLFESVISFQDPSWDEALSALGGAWANREWDIHGHPNYPLALDVAAGRCLTIKIVYARERFADAHIAAMLGHLRVLLAGMTDRACRVGDLPLLSHHECRQLREWNETQAEFPATRSVAAYVEAHAGAAPKRLAVADDEVSLSYAELNLRANRLAHRLKKLEVSADSLVAVCLPRSAAMVVAWLGVAKAGGAFVPLDPTYPKERIAFQLEDCRALVLVTQPELRASLPRVSAGVTVIELTADGGELADEPGTNLATSAAPRDLAYVIYTSGSTGLPKGVMVEHRSLMNLVTWHQRRYDVTAADRATQLASPAFDASIWEIWPYLAAGASVHIPSEEVRMSPALLWSWLAHRRITIAFMPTPLAEAAMAENVPEGVVLRALLTGGDKLRRRPAKNFRPLLINHYGPTENTVVATSTIVASDDSPAAPAIGHPIANTRCHVLDAKRRELPPGIAGELYIGGDSLARGYLGRDALTEEKFIPDPFAKPGADSRLYRTGDLVRWTNTGELEFLGRLDNQVKIRGHRIELGEIEAVMHAHPAGRESLVVAAPDHRGEPQLVAYLVRQKGVTTERELAEFLRAKLPAVMIPAAFVFLSDWPLTPNGKIDRRALPLPAPATVDEPDFVRPFSPTEESIARIWAEVLNRPKIGRHDNFFELGGHSLLAAQAVSRLNRLLSGAFSVRTIFDHPTVAELAVELTHSDNRGTPQACPPSSVMHRRASEEIAVGAQH